MSSDSVLHNGLEGVVVAETEISHVDGDAGVLVLRGHYVEQLAPASSVEAAAHLLWYGALPTPAEAQVMQRRLFLGRARAFELWPVLRHALQREDAMDALRAATGQLSESDHADLPALLTGALPVFAAAHARLRQGLAPCAPAAERSHAADYLAMLHGREPSPDEVRALETYLVTISDHGMNASTFAARVVASTGSDSVSAVVAAIGALKGPLHGGAPGPVLDMLDTIATPEHASAWLARELDAGRRIMGMGHRVYRVRDPRAAVLEAAVRELAATTDNHSAAHTRLVLARAVEDAAALLDLRHGRRKLRANVEFFTAVLLDALGIDRTLFTATFAVGRVLGWCAHLDEQHRNGRLIRPASRYVGPWPSDVPVRDMGALSSSQSAQLSGAL